MTGAGGCAVSLKSEVEEFLDWYVKLRAATEVDGGTTPVAVTKRSWANLSDNLTRVAGLFGNAATALGVLTSPSGVAIAAELARSLQRETEDLQRRAATLGLRADPEPPGDTATRRRVIVDRIRAMDDENPARTELEEELDELDASEAPAAVPPTPTLADAEKSLKDASRTLETARTKVAGKHGDAAAGFLDELEVVIEMNLSLRRRCAELGSPA
ncbi:hypothetical protein [Nocardioides sp. 1609]|uniref:hypothetical protein n=1 Tax=Nocardioides sp. 1609 TaxID=2508327 RepID=UPI00106F690D|nr:hypothetical protein [Nocardioides sp. 1609]